MNGFTNKNKYYLHFANRKSEAIYVTGINLHPTEWKQEDWEALGDR